MSKTKILSGIELGSSKIATIIAKVSFDPVINAKTINLVGVSSVESKGIKKGQIVDIDEAVEATISSVEAAERMAGYNLDNAVVSLGGAHVASQNSQGIVAVSDPGGEINYDDVDRVIEAASAVSLPSSRELIHVLPREFVVDGEEGVKDPVGMSGVRLEVQTHLVTASNAAVKNLKKAINEVGIKVNNLIFSGLAASEAVLTKTEKELGCVLIDVGGGTTSIAAYVDGALSYSSVLPIGAKNVSNDLAIGLRVSLEVAEKIKLALSAEDKKAKKVKDQGASDEFDLESLGINEIKKVSKKTLTEGIIKPRLNEIFSMVKIALDREGLAARVPAGAVITGGGAETVGASEAARRMLSLPVRIGIPKGVGGLIDDVMNPTFAVAIGLILHSSDFEDEESLTSFSKKIKLPSKGIVGKLIASIKDLLP
ncbi:cell division protein FtsA [Candidatus Woesebacteria bacterium RIFCSPHIGHO2_01_FULL_39_17]|uniref:Cell division protein FtsA n=2 Tax=Candidatus Woeseibacteriota TaxID=1752722 RepID=A0A0G0NCE8_9BACT|nr:MAG: Cell division protein ftsA [Microgenomates group bacterium GW2011_GWC1_38_12]KKR13138.1 MAG: Cell division protein ftsA [Candidatus Woesebacteria bacterium GW2011_GWA1_39_21b]OGM22292.1 MAG: cell division protein FtsA [Candidatus Woesebacteria bacterium RIFCSPHIGHO2_01_FULL_39_17]OGM61873.1 MAG: cell division protein FtsA [Candidatus Woesebacteria bacterium RIFCSPLOWO2_01_FULL_39_14]